VGDQPEDGRTSRITTGTRLLFADLHNHSMFSDGAGDPEAAFGQLRAAGLDAAALTDHASIPHDAIPHLDPRDYPDAEALALAQHAPHSLDDHGWRRTAELADRADVPGVFTALRGFEWTEPWLGHANVWFSERRLNVDTPGRVEGLHTWLAETEPAALFGYNHPGREPGQFHDFALEPGLVERMVGLEAFNRYDDYLFAGWGVRGRSPLAACLDAGWRPGLIGVSDEHGRSYGLVGKGRTGIWVREHSREGVREALAARRTFATREVGLLLDATLGGVRMGGSVSAGGRQRELLVDLAGPAPYAGMRVELQLLASAGPPPKVVAVFPATIGEVAGYAVDVPDAAWLILRAADPARRNATPGPDGHAGNAYGLADASPWYLDQ
jgi:hypothetical protein